MSVKIRDVSAAQLRAIQLTYNDRFEATKTTVKFWGRKNHVLKRLREAQDGSGDAARYVRAVARKVAKAAES